MLITKKQSKNLRYFARANYKSEYKSVETENGKVKHRKFPCFELSYDESKSVDGLVELTNVTIGSKPFEGDYSALMTRLREILDNPGILGAEELEQDKTLTEQAVDAVKDKSDTIVIAEKPGDIIKETLKDCFPEGSEISVDVNPEENKIDANVFIPNSVDHIDATIEVKPVEESLEYLATHEPPPLEVAPLEEQPVQELPVIEDVEEAKQVAEETGTPVITAEQKTKKTRAELYDLQIKCATMRLATSYGEPPETDIGSLMTKYPDAVEKLNALYAADGIKTYTITEDAIQQAYPDEYAALC